MSRCRPPGPQRRRALRVGFTRAALWTPVAAFLIGCSAVPSAPVPAASPSLRSQLSTVSTAEGASVAQTIFYCSQAADTDELLRATRGAGATHTLALDECRKQLALAEDDVTANRRLVASTHWRAGSRGAAAQLGNDLQRVTDILGTISLAASSDDRQAIGEALSTLGGAEGRVEYEESQLTA